MRSAFTTLLLAALALLLGGLAVVQFKEQDLTSIFGAPPRQVGETLFSFDEHSPARLTLSNSLGEVAEFHKKAGQWFMISPTPDRADYRHLQSLVFATRHLLIEEAIPADQLSRSEAGLETGHYELKIVDRAGHDVAHYKLGRRTPWHHLAGKNGELSETFFIEPIGEFEDGNVYVCAGANARVLLDLGVPILRDHRPFLFNATELASIDIHHKNGDVLVSRQDLQSPWRITKPLDLRTDPESVARLVRGLYETQALKIHDPGAVTIPPRKSNRAFIEISLHFFDRDGTIIPTPTTLQVEAPVTEDADTAYAKVSGRTAIFELPLKPANGHLSLAELPVTVNDLRSRTLLSRPPSSLQSATINADSLHAPLVLSLGKDPGTDKPRWIITRNGIPEPANESTVFRLFTALTINKVLGFASDAPADLAPFGLDPPAKSVVLHHSDDQRIQLDLGQTPDGKYYALRHGEAGVVEIDSRTFDYIEIQASAWRDSLLWSMSIVDLEGFIVERPNQAPLLLNYNFLTELWSAKQDGQDLTILLNKQRANILLDHLENLRVTRWLGPTHPEAATRLEHPLLTFEIAYRVEDDFGDVIGIHRRLLNLAPISFAPNNRLYYGRLSGDNDYFLINKEAFDHLNVPLITK